VSATRDTLNWKKNS